MQILDSAKVLEHKAIMCLVNRNNKIIRDDTNICSIILMIVEIIKT